MPTNSPCQISITLEELGVQYNARKIEFSKNEQKEPWFLEINRKPLCHLIHRKESSLYDGDSMGRRN